MTNTRLIEVDLPFMREVDELWNGEEERPSHLRSAHPSTIPARNAIIYAVAAHYAEILGIDTIVAGHNADDTKYFPDTSREFRRLISKALTIGTYIGRAKGLESLRHCQDLARPRLSDSVLNWVYPLSLRGPVIIIMMFHVANAVDV